MPNEELPAFKSAYAVQEAPICSAAKQQSAICLAVCEESCADMLPVSSSLCGARNRHRQAVVYTDNRQASIPLRQKQPAIACT